MSVAFAKKAFRNFVADATPGVLCIKGKWGTGKTYAWEQTVKEATLNNTFTMKKYAYISLFGVKDASDIMQAIYATADNPAGNKVEQFLPEKIAGYQRRELALWKRVKSTIGFAAEHATVPHIAGLGGIARAILAGLVSDTLICIDDFERKGESVSVNEIMGVIAQLRDARRCKVVLILNEDSLNSKDQDDFRRYSEKVINRVVRFMPTEAEATAIAFPASDPLSAVLRSHCAQLGITNIRVMFKIRDIASDIVELMTTIDKDIENIVLKSLVVLVWAASSPPGEGAPTISYLKDKRGRPSAALEEAADSQEEVEWGVILNDYGFSHCDDLDLVMIDGIENGFFNDEKVGDEIAKLLRNSTKIRADNALSNAWGVFHDSFDKNPDDVAMALYSGCVSNIEFLPPTNLSSAVTILKEVGHQEDAATLLRTYMEKRGGDDIFNLEKSVFGDNVKDPDVLEAFSTKAKGKAAKLPDPTEAARRIHSGSWRPEDEESLAKLTVDDFVRIFKSMRGKERREFIFGSLQFKKVTNPTELQKRIVDNACAALKVIGRESALNAHRLVAYGIPLHDVDQDGVDNAGSE